MWWPEGAGGHPVSGDPDVPTVLLELLTAEPGPPAYWVGVGPAGGTAPVRPGTRSQRWDGDDCSLSLSWTGDPGTDVLDRMVASVPAAWR